MDRWMRKAIQIIAICLMIISAFPFFLTITECIDTGYHGFGVDSQGQLYLGKRSCIRVYLDGALVDTIKLPDYRYYWMTVEKDHIVIAGDSVIETYTLQWELVSEESDYSADAYDAMREKHTSVTVSGTKYTIQSQGFEQTIVDDNGMIHYRTPRDERFGRMGCTIFGFSYWSWVITYFANKGLFQQLRDKVLGLYHRIRGF